jgi:hypothetical protein
MIVKNAKTGNTLFFSRDVTFPEDLVTSHLSGSRRNYTRSNALEKLIAKCDIYLIEKCHRVLLNLDLLKNFVKKLESFAYCSFFKR